MVEVAGKPAKTKRVGWSQLQVAELVAVYSTGRGVGPVAGFTAEQCRAKLIELGIIQRAPKPVLSDAAKVVIDKALHDAVDIREEPDRSLAARYAIKRLQELLPKRPVAK